MPTIAVEDTEKLRAFEQRMQMEGAAAFAAGPAPWEHWDEVGTLDHCRIWRDALRHGSPVSPPRKPLTTRLLTGLAQLALLALLVGTAGVYVSTLAPEPVASNGIQPPPIVASDWPALRPVTRALRVVRIPAGPPAPSNPATDTATAGDTMHDMPLAGAAPAPHPGPAAPAADSPAGAAGQALTLALDALPGTAAGPARVSVATPETNPGPSGAEPGGKKVDADGPATDKRPQQIALHTAVIDSLPEKPADAPAPAHEVRDLAGTWVVNLASYNFESMARRKLALFQGKGVDAEIVHVTVKGRPMIRIRTTGYKSYREAIDWVALLEERLDLEGAWVAKYQSDEN